MVSHTRKTPGAGSLRSVKPGAAKLESIKPVAVKPDVKKPEPLAPGAVNQSAQSLQFRSLNLPVPIDVVENNSERPISVTLPPASSDRSRRPARSRQLSPETQPLSLTSLTVTAINDLWQVDDEWWRERPISRRYYQITTQDNRRLTIFKDQLNAQWYWQKGG